jgi:ubiquitin carboxyl-terminal hydrolase 8
MQGLGNLGNTCSINTLIQCVGHSDSLRTFLLDKAYVHHKKGNYSITEEWKHILHQMWVEQQSLLPKRFLSALYEKLDFLVHGEQHDICEVWMLLCESIACECMVCEHVNSYKACNSLLRSWNNKNKGYARMLEKASSAMQTYNKDNACEWLDLIQGVQVSQIHCQHCNEVYHNFEPFTMLTLEIPNKEDVSLLDCLEAFLTAEKTTSWKCDKCAHESAEKLVRFWKVPQTLFICIKRFSHVGLNLQKNNAPIGIPFKIRIDKGCILGPEFMGTDKQSVSYELRSVGLHHGSLHGGHYTAIGKHGGDYYHYDDLQINKIEMQNGFTSSEAYLIVYDQLPSM